MKPKLGQIAMFGPHTYEIGRVSRIRKNGFYVRVKNAYPTIPGGHKYAYHSRFFPFSAIGSKGFQGGGEVTISD